MNKILFTVTLALSLMMSSVTFTACKCDDDEANQIEENNLPFFTADIKKKIYQDQKLIEQQGWGNLVIHRDEYAHLQPVTLNENANFVVNTLNDAGYECYIVGGTVRDYLMGTHSMDYDFCTNATYTDCERLFGDAFSLHWIGEEGFGGVVINGEHLDLATYMNIKPSDVGMERLPDGDNFSRLNDSFRRDLGFNAIYFDPYTGDLIDNHGGLYDILTKSVNCIGMPSHQLSTNTVSLIRVIRFAARYDFSINRRVCDILKTEGMKYLEKFPANSYPMNVYRCFSDGYAQRCGKYFSEFSMWPFICPGLKKSANQQAGIKYLEDLMPSFDQTAWSAYPDQLSKLTFVYSSLYGFRNTELRKSGLTPSEAAEAVMLEADQVSEFWPDEREAIKQALIDRME